MMGLLLIFILLNLANNPLDLLLVSQAMIIKLLSVLFCLHLDLFPSSCPILFCNAITEFIHYNLEL
jgi:hypothetical protein